MHAETRTQTTDKSSTRYPPAARTQQEETSNAATNKPLPWNFSVYSVNVLPLSFKASHKSSTEFKGAVSWLLSLFLLQICKIYVEVPCSCINCFQTTKETNENKF